MTKDMTQGSPLKLILAFAVPLMLGSLFQQFYNLADTIIVGRFDLHCINISKFLPQAWAALWAWKRWPLWAAWAV